MIGGYWRKALCAGLLAGAAVSSLAAADKTSKPLDRHQAEKAKKRLPASCEALQHLEWEGAILGSFDPFPIPSEAGRKFRAEAGATHDPDGPIVIEVQIETSNLYSEHTRIDAVAARAADGAWSVSRVTRKTGGMPPPPPPPLPPPLPGDPPSPPLPPMPVFDRERDIYEGPLSAAEAQTIEHALADPCMKYEPAAVRPVPDSSSIGLTIRTPEGVKVLDRSSTGGLPSDAIVDTLAEATGPGSALDWGEYRPPAPAAGGSACTPAPAADPAAGRQLAERLRGDAANALRRHFAAKALVSFLSPSIVRIIYSPSNGIVGVDAKGNDGVWRTIDGYGAISAGDPGDGRRIEAALRDPCLDRAPVASAAALADPGAYWRARAVLLVEGGQWRAWMRQGAVDGPLGPLF